jgi:glutamyl-tRNA synthetase
MKDVRVRFAPSPTGPLHIGGVRTALFNFLFARQHKGTHILRIEDTDRTRFVEGAENYIITALQWLGITFDEGPHVGGSCEPYRQSERKHMYRQYVEQLIESGHAYYAFDTPEELENMRQRLKDSGMSPQYDAISRGNMKNSLTLSADEVALRIQQGEPYVVRIKLPRKEEIRFNDLIRGWVSFHTHQLDDKVLMKADGMPTYHMANVVDDYLMRISHVIRGEEWLPSAPIHVLLYRFLGWESHMPEFAHLPLILKPEGNGKLSKRDGDRLGFPVFPLQWTDPVTGDISSGYRESGYEPQAVVNMLALLGWHPSHNQELFSIEELIDAFTIEKISKNGAKFDLDKAKWFNHQYLLQRDNQHIQQELQTIYPDLLQGYSAEYIQKVAGLMKEKVTFAKEIGQAGAYFFQDHISHDAALIQSKWKQDTPDILQRLAAELEGCEPFEASRIEASMAAFLQAHQLKPGQVMLPVRLAVTGQGGGPPLQEVLETLGKNRVVNRLDWASKNISIAT